MPRFNAESAGNVQPGRVMIVLRETCVPDDVIRDMVDKQGEVKSMHRPANNQQLCFIQYADPDTAARAIEELRSFPLFKAVDPALKSERYQENHPNDQNQKKQQNKQFNQNRNDGRNNYNNNNFKRNDGGFNNRNGDMDSPPRQASMETQQEVPLGCWYCAKMPNFECQCGAFYCDTGCQRADWSKHKDNCMPRMVPISFSNKMILQQAVASRNASTISSTPYTPSSPEYSGNNQQQQRQQPQQNRFNGNDYNQQQQQQQYGQRNYSRRNTNAPNYFC